MAGARRGGDVAADRDRAGRPGLATVRGPLADARGPRRARAPTNCSRLGRGWATTAARWRCVSARGIVSDHGGRVPATVAELESLPGIGPVHGPRGRGRGIPGAGRAARRQRPPGRLARARGAGLVPGLQAGRRSRSRGQPGRWLDAVMDLASGTCLPRAPQCDACPLAVLCASRGVVVAVEPKAAAVPFPMTSRWLRGRLVAAVTAAPAGTWVAVARPARPSRRRRDPRAAARGLEREGFIELQAGRRECGSNGVARALTSATLRRCPPLPTHRPPTRLRRCPPTIHRSSSWTCAALRRHWAARAALPAISAETMTGADRRAQALGYPGAPADGARRDRRCRRGQGPRRRTSSDGGPARSSSCAVPATTAATALSRRAGWPSPGAPVIVALVAAEARPAACRPRATGTGSPGIPGSSRSTCRSPVTWRCSAWAWIRRRSSSMRCSARASGAPCASRSVPRSRSSARARAAGVPVVAVDTPDRDRPVQRRAVGSGGPGRPDGHLPPPQDRPADAPRRGPRRQGPRRPDRHPAGGRPWLSRAGVGKQPGWREVLLVAGLRRGRRPRSGHPDQHPADGCPGGGLPHAARDHRADRGHWLAAVAHLAPAARPARAMTEPPAATPAPAAHAARAPGGRPATLAAGTGTSSSSAAGSSGPAPCSTPCRAACGPRSSSRTTSGRAHRRARRASSMADSATSSSSASGSSAKRSPSGRCLLDSRRTSSGSSPSSSRSTASRSPRRRSTTPA